MRATLLASFGKAVQIKPGYAEAHNSLGTALQGQGRLDEAIASYDKALQIKPELAIVHNNRGAALKIQNRFDAAIESFSNAVRSKPDYFEANFNLGLVFRDLGRLDEAKASFKKALQIKPDHVGAHGILCGIHEMQNDTEELEKALEIAVRHCGEDHAEILYRLAQLAIRKNQHVAAADYLNRIQIEKLEPALKSLYFNLLAKTCDKLGRFDEAFSAFEKQNALTLASAEAKKISASAYLSGIQMRKNAWTTDARPNWTGRPSSGGQISPTFLVGFPRSGTTLLDTILRSHPEICVVEEQPMVKIMGNAFNREHTIENFNGLSEAEVLGLQKAYFEELGMHLDPKAKGKLIVDKLPMNIAHAGLISRVFPDAKFILALRHPCDCVLSCFMQTFKLNHAMANFLSLEQSARLYAAVMELWSAYRQKLGPEVHVLKYEDLIQDLEGACRPLIEFLGLTWDENLHNYQKTAAERVSINTPSYSQVVQPLYTQASGRWTNYRKQMEPVLPVLESWIKSFGY